MGWGLGGPARSPELAVMLREQPSVGTPPLMTLPPEGVLCVEHSRSLKV